MPRPSHQELETLQQRLEQQAARRRPKMKVHGKRVLQLRQTLINKQLGRRRKLT